MNRPIFDHIVCARCGGSGEYSYSTAYGRACFKCGGSGYLLTKKGEAAMRYFNKLRTVLAKDIKQNDMIINKNTGVKEVALKDAHMGDDMYITFETNKCNYGVFKDDEFFRALNKKEKAENIKICLEYQSKLTKQGKLMAKYAKNC